MISANHLKEFAFFKGFSDQELTKLSGVASEETVPAGTQMYKNGDPARGLFLVQEGKVVLVMDSNLGPHRPPMQVTVDVVTKGESMGWSAVVEPYVYTHKDSINTYQNYDRSIGHWLGPDSDDLCLKIDYRHNRDIQMGLTAERTRHGEGDLDRPHTPADGNRKKFLSGTVETTWSYGFSISDQVYRDIFINLNYYFLRTGNLHRIAGNNSTDTNVSLQLKINW